ncbi:MAG: MBL fold metallo-hydrolase [Planctomycetota bacterium]
MKITFWGVRGSIATSGEQFSRFGGNTTCIEVEAEGERIIIDAGTGVRGLGQKLMAESKTSGPVKASFLFTHLHWDHIQGFPFFTPAYVPTSELRLYGPDEGTQTLEGALAKQMTPPNFPVTLAAMGAKKTFNTVSDGEELQVGKIAVRVRALSHPQGSLGYRFDAGGRSFCFATDTEHLSETDVDEALLDLAKGADVFVYDAQYTPDEYAGKGGPPRKGWGHSTYVAAARAARACGSKHLGLFHHDPMHDDEAVKGIEAEGRLLFPGTFAAREGLSITLKG